MSRPIDLARHFLALADRDIRAFLPYAVEFRYGFVEPAGLDRGAVKIMVEAVRVSRITQWRFSCGPILFRVVVSYNKEARTLRIWVFINQQPLMQEVFSP
jgi:hypothetical protein